MRRRAGLAALSMILLAFPAAAAWYPTFNMNSVRVLVGESTDVVEVHPVWTGLWVVPWKPWVFFSTDPQVAWVEGRMELGSWQPGRPSITGIRPGNAELQIEGVSDFYHVAIEVVCGVEPPARLAVQEVDIRIGQPVTMHALTPIAYRTAFHWYSGPLGDRSHPLPASGPIATFVPAEIGLQHAWVEATTPCSSSSAELAIDVHGLRRRMVRP